VESLKQTFSTCKVIHDTVMFHQSSLALERTLINQNLEPENQSRHFAPKEDTVVKA